jgi:hypothetical protein
METKKPLVKERADRSRRSKVIFHNTQEDTGDVVAQMNGVAYQIQREKEVNVSSALLTMLDDCIITTFERDTKGEEITRDIKRFPYTKVA